MPIWKPLALGFAAVAVAAATCVPPVGDRRSVAPVVTASASVTEFDPRQAAALFVGVREFTHRGVAEVPYAADDAVDLAHLFALDPRVSLVPPSRVVLALSGRPQKGESRRRLEELRQAGAEIEDATADDIATLLERQAALAGSNGIFILSLATHGFLHDGVPHILGSTSRFDSPLTALPAPRLFDVIASSAAARSVIFVDACRERIRAGTRGSSAQPATAAPLLRRMQGITGQVIFYAAAAGGYAYDGDGNGVFTQAILDGLRCNATATRQIVTVTSLHRHVERQVRGWIRLHRDPSIESAIQVSIDGRAELMPLAMCPPPLKLISAETEGSRVTALDADGNQLWVRDVGARIVEDTVIDLDADGRMEVVVATRRSLVTFDSAGNRAWSSGDGMTLRTFVAGNLQNRATRQVLALWHDEHSSASRLVSYDAEGRELASYDYDKRLERIAVYRPTTRHDPRVVAAGMHEVLVLMAKKLDRRHRRVIRELILGLDIVDHDRDGKNDIALQTPAGRTCLTLEGSALNALN